MNFLDIILIGLALAMDAFGVSLGIGINSSVIKKQKLLYIISFPLTITSALIIIALISGDFTLFPSNLTAPLMLVHRICTVSCFPRFEVWFTKVLGLFKKYPLRVQNKFTTSMATVQIRSLWIWLRNVFSDFS